MDYFGTFALYKAFELKNAADLYLPIMPIIIKMI